MISQVTEYNSLDRTIHPPYLHPPYRSTIVRSPQRPLIQLPQSMTELSGPVFGTDVLQPLDDDLTRNAVKNSEPIGERIIVTGRILDDTGRAIRNALVEVWQANSAGRYFHKIEQHAAPLDPNFTGTGRCLTNENGEYRFTTIKPGAYPWGNHSNAWRPAHIHFSIFGNNFLQRLVTQMYFPGDSLLLIDPIFNGVPDADARKSLIANYAHHITQPDWALGYSFDLIVCGPRQTPFEA